MNTNTQNLFSKIFVALILLWMSVLWWKQTEPTFKEMQIMSVVETHALKGFGFTHGYNVYPERGGPYSDIDHTKMGGVTFYADTNYTAYVSVPVMVPIAAWSFYSTFELGIHSSKAVFLFFSFVSLFLFFLLGDQYVEAGSRWVYNCFVLSPFFIFNFFYNDINLNSLVLTFSLGAYLAYLNFLKTGENKFFWLFSGSLFIASWSSFFVAGLYPVFFLHAIFDNRIAKERKLKALLSLTCAIGFILATLVVYYGMLPGALDKAISRVVERISGVEDIRKYEDQGRIPLMDFISKLLIRINSHFTPISFLLAIVALLVSTTKLIKQLVRESWAIDTVNKDFILLMCFITGVPSALLFYTGSFIHPYFTFQWIPFFILGSYMGVQAIAGYFPKFRKTVTIGIVGVFLLIAIPRSYVKLTRNSLIDLLFNGEHPSWYKQTS